MSFELEEPSLLGERVVEGGRKGAEERRRSTRVVDKGERVRLWREGLMRGLQDS